MRRAACQWLAARCVGGWHTAPVKPANLHPSSTQIASTATWPAALSRSRHGLLLAVSVVPNATCTAAAGWHGGALRVRLAAPPVDGAANEALLRWLADALGLRRSDVLLVHGASSRRKQVQIDAPAKHVLAWLESAVPAP